MVRKIVGIEGHRTNTRHHKLGKAVSGFPATFSRQEARLANCSLIRGGQLINETYTFLRFHQSFDLAKATIPLLVEYVNKLKWKREVRTFCENAFQFLLCYK